MSKHWQDNFKRYDLESTVKTENKQNVSWIMSVLTYDIK